LRIWLIVSKLLAYYATNGHLSIYSSYNLLYNKPRITDIYYYY